MKKMLGLFVLSAMLLPGRVWAQQVPIAGDRVRVVQEDGTVSIGELSSLTSEELRLLVGADAREVVIRRDRIGEIQRSLGEQRSFGKHFGTIVGLGAAAGGLVWALTWSPCTGGGLFACAGDPDSRGEAFVWGVAGGAILGVPLGVLVGLAAKSERWESVSMPGPSGTVISLVPVIGTRFGVAGFVAIGGW